MTKLEIAIVSFVAGALFVLLVAVRGVEFYQPFSQANFPCQEDEGLMFAPQFGYDKVGCLSIETVESR